MTGWYIGYGLFSIVMFFVSCHYMFRKEKYGNALYYYFLFLYSGICLVDIATWIFCDKSIAVFYICVVSIFVLYIIFCAYSISFYKKAHMLSNKGYYLIIGKTLIIIISLMFIFWILVLLGIFVYNNQIIKTDNVYALIPEYEGFLPSFAFLIGELKAAIRFAEIGIIQLFAYNSNNPMWTAFFQSARWSYGSIIIITVINIITNVIGISSMSFSNVKTNDSIDSK